MNHLALAGTCSVLSGVLYATPSPLAGLGAALLVCAALLNLVLALAPRRLP